MVQQCSTSSGNSTVAFSVVDDNFVVTDGDMRSFGEVLAVNRSLEA